MVKDSEIKSHYLELPQKEDRLWIEFYTELGSLFQKHLMEFSTKTKEVDLYKKLNEVLQSKEI